MKENVSRKKKILRLLTKEFTRASQNEDITKFHMKSFTDGLGVSFEHFAGSSDALDSPHNENDTNEIVNVTLPMDSQIVTQESFSVTSIDWDVRGSSLRLLLTVQSHDSEPIEFRSVSLHSPPNIIITGKFPFAF